MLGGHYLELMRFFMGYDVKAVQAMSGRPVGNIDEPLEVNAEVGLRVLQVIDAVYESARTGQRVEIEYGT